MLDDVVTLLSNLVWMKYVEINCVPYNQLIIKFLSSLNIDWGVYVGIKRSLSHFECLMRSIG